jgi:uncharacterized membrane protein
MTSGALFLAVFLACLVEAVEALTIVLAAGTSRDWRSALTGVLAAVSVLAAAVVALGPALAAIPLTGLRLAVGGLLLVFGLQWLRKAILRAAGIKALHNEDTIFQTTVAAARAAPRADVEWSPTGTASPWRSRACSSKGSRSSSSR